MSDVAADAPEGQGLASWVSTRPVDLTLLAAGLALLGIACWSAGPLPFSPGLPVYAAMPVAYFASLAILVTATFVARRPSLRVAGTLASIVAATLPVCLLLPYGKFHDSPNNLLASIVTIHGGTTLLYQGGFPGFWILTGYLFDASGLDPWVFSRLFPLGVMVVYVGTFELLIAGLFREESRDAGWGRAEAAGALLLLVVGQLIWMRNNLAPETIGFALSMVLVYLLVRRRDSLWFLAMFAITALALIASHPLSPLLVLPGVLVALVEYPRSQKKGIVARLFQAPFENVLLIFLILYLAWILYESGWIVGHAVGLVSEALTSEREVTGITRVIPGSEWVGIAKAVFFVGMAAWLALPLIKLRRDRFLRTSLLWIALMGPIFVAALGGRFFSRPLLFVLVPISLAAAWLVGRTLLRPSNLAWLSLGFALLVVVGTVSTGYVESYDRVTTSELQAYSYAYANERSVYTPALRLPFKADGSPLPHGDETVGPARGYNTTLATLYTIHIVTPQSLAYAALEQGTPWPVNATRIAEAEPLSGVIYANHDSLVLLNVRDRPLLTKGPT
ncbi:MAG: hypothetical protein QOE90_3478 [Thermoplasmata archaeon]|jgi:hypothetical protein|nr:hypothetical protein [Thermoplasmata archaeon]